MEIVKAVEEVGHKDTPLPRKRRGEELLKPSESNSTKLALNVGGVQATQGNREAKDIEVNASLFAIPQKIANGVMEVT